MAEFPSDLCDTWMLGSMPVPQYSRLFHLSPMNVGTAYTESSTSFVEALADEHGVPPQVLIGQIILPEMNPSYLQSSYYNSFHNGDELLRRSFASYKFFKGSQTLNGIGTMAIAWTLALGTLTLRQELRFLTMLPWSGVL